MASKLSLNLRKPICALITVPQITIHKKHTVVIGWSKKVLSFEEYQKKSVKCFDEFEKSPYIQVACEGDIEKIAKAYEDYSRSRYNRYLLSQYSSGNPAHMV